MALTTQLLPVLMKLRLLTLMQMQIMRLLQGNKT